MIRLNVRTVKGKKVNEMGVKCEDIFLADLYHAPSSAKVSAYKKAKETCRNEGGTAFRIGNANCYQFTATWVIKDGNKIYRRVLTKDNSYIVEL